LGFEPTDPELALAEEFAGAITNMARAAGLGPAQEGEAK
jgi:hypothetical protein